MTSNLKQTEKSHLIIELQRKRKAVDQLQMKLNSYQCAPKTSFLFEKMATLKTELKTLANNTEALLATLSVNGIVLVDYMENVKQQFSNFNMLHTEIEEYIKAARQ
ncbi:hypothetical protein JQC67_13675 [Aurantibacter crassamenti]|uniref:hypothetical protein n=1 Tax=Aurantibacter crassamenti TaxID=1837375 RepID=UPI001939D400|nr:hypothetical protein [Aurantibacter crassamenti]MBM1107198.1 hypothetical protein [Aurantibacter crassamenti]